MVQFSLPTIICILAQNAFFAQTPPFFAQTTSFFAHKSYPRAFFTPKRLQLFGHISDLPSTTVRPPPSSPLPARKGRPAPPAQPPPRGLGGVSGFETHREKEGVGLPRRICLPET